jgi:hypothetical protein
MEDKGGIAPEGGVARDSDPEGADLALLDLSEVDESASLDMAVIPVALGEAGVAAPSLGPKNVQAESSIVGWQ